MQEFIDDSLGRVVVRRHHNARGIRFRLSPRRELVATAPPRTPLMLVKTAVRRSRRDIQKLLDESEHQITYIDSQQIGQSHKLQFISTGAVSAPHARRSATTIVVSLPEGMDSSHDEAQAAAQSAVIAAIGREARAYLPRRIATLAERHGYSYSRIRYTHTTSRWGSCSSSGVISLNIALMKLPLELIDYVLLHELCHTKQMNHSDNFWQLVQSADPYWRDHRRRVKSYSPML